MAKCLVIGGNGFLGSHLVDELAAAGHEVVVFDRFSSGKATYTASGVTQFAGDFLSVADLRDAVAGQEYVFHFLSTTTPAIAEDDPSIDVRTNVAQSVELFDVAVAAGVSRVFFASTGGAIYGNQPESTITEQALPAPVSPYAIGKQAIENYLRYYRRKHGLESTSFRISNPYGPRQHPNKKQGVIPIFLQRIAAGEPIEFYGDGSMVRDYLYVEDAAKLIAATVDTTPTHHVYNIGSGVGATLDHVLELAGEITGREIEVVRLPQPSTFVQHSVLDMSRYQAEFGAPALRSLRDGMSLTWAATLEQQS